MSMISAAVSNYTYMKRVTITIPEYIYDYLQNNIKPGQVSDFVVNAVKERLIKGLLEGSVDPWERFFNAYQKITKKSNISIKGAINKGRK